MNFRPERVGKLIREELSKIILREVELPALATITEVEVDKKLDGARVNVSVIPSALQEEVVEALQKKAGYLQHLLLKKMNIKPMPRIVFAVDHGFEKAALVEKLFEHDSMKNIPPADEEEVSEDEGAGDAE